MGKQTGIGARLWVGAYDLSGDTGAINSIATSRAQLDVTGLDKEFFERLPGLGDGSIDFTGFFNQPNNHTVLSPMGTAAMVVTAAFGTAVGVASASLSGAEASYSVTRGTDGSLANAAQFMSQAGYGVEWGSLLNGGASASGTGTANDGGTATTSGASAYLHVTSVTAGTVTVIVEHSTSGTASWTTVTGLSFTATSAGTAERVATATGGTVNRYTRYSVSGGTAVFALNLHRG